MTQFVNTTTVVYSYRRSCRPHGIPRELRYRNREDAENLLVTRKAVELHLGRVFATLGIRSGNELARSSAPRTS